jgi:hypothetical protein
MAGTGMAMEWKDVPAGRVLDGAGGEERNGEKLQKRSEQREIRNDAKSEGQGKPDYGSG